APPEVAEDWRRNWARPRGLRHENGGQVLPRVRVPPCAHAAVPAERSDSSGCAVVRREHRDAEAPAVVIEEAAGKSWCDLLLRRELIPRHQRYGFSRQNANARVLAVMQQHVPEGEVVVHARDKPRAARWESRWAAPLAGGGVVEEHERSALRVGEIARRKAPLLLGRHAESGIAHTERIEEAPSQERIERPTRRPCDEHAENVGSGVV